MYNIVIEFGIFMKLVRLIIMCLTETYSRARVGKDLSDVFPLRSGLKHRNALWPLLFDFALEYVIRRVNYDGLKLNDTHQLLFYNDDLNILCASTCTIKGNTEASVYNSNEIGLELSDKKTKYMVMSRDQHAVQNHNIYIRVYR